MKAMKVIERPSLVELPPPGELHRRHNLLPLGYRSATKGQRKDVPKPLLAVGLYAFPGSLTDMTA